MPVTHTFKTIGSTTKTASLTPIKAIRANCIACVQGAHWVEECMGFQCALYPFRLGNAHAMTAEQRERLRLTARKALEGSLDPSASP